MKYETPQLTALTNAITAIQSSSNKFDGHHTDTYIVGDPPEVNSAYADWE